MKNALLTFAAVVSLSLPVFAAGNPDGKIFKSYEEANQACRAYAHYQGRSYMVSAYYDLSLTFKGWICRVGNGNH